MTLGPGQRIGHYRIEGEIGRGGMGVVYRATDTRLDRSVAVKVLPPNVTSDPERRARFQQEARLAAGFSHPNIATIHDVGEEEGITFIVMEAVRGRSLRDLIGHQGLPIDRVLAIAEGVAAGLARAHEDGVIHRDLKPDNVMLTEEGLPKILDFGLGKLVQESKTASARDPDDERGRVEVGEDTTSQTETVTRAAEPEAPGSPYVTRAGQVLGTLGYMSPEQVKGRPVDVRSDVFSFGVLLYEMLAGRPPFTGESKLDTATSILRDAPPPLEKVRRDIPATLQKVLSRCLAKDPAARYASARELHDTIRELRRRHAAPGLPAVLKRRRVVVGAALVLAAVVAGVVWFTVRASRIDWARNTALPEASRLADAGDRDAAYRLLRQAAEVIPEDPRLLEQMASRTFIVSIESEPAGAEVLVRGYTHVDRPWIRLGETPLSDVPVPIPTRFRIQSPGYIPLESSGTLGREQHFVLYREGEAPESMVRVSAGRVEFGGAAPVAVEAFWIDKYEVTNRQFKEFVDDGGYGQAGFWPDVSLEQVDSLFVDATGRPGPSGWELGSYPEGKGDEPVGGVSWYEARAYAAWAGKSLPTVFHWHRAAQQTIFSEIVTLSNFDGKGPAPVGSFPGVGPTGTYDMAGNVREWCLNNAGGRRYILGGGWSDPIYMYRDAEASDPFGRAAVNGLRCMKTDGPLSEEETAAVEDPVFDFRKVRPVDDEIFDVLRGLYGYDRADLDARVESADETSESWRHEIVSVRAAYGDERLPIHLFLPTNAPPPYPAVIYFPGGGARQITSSRHLRLDFASFIPKSGRALVCPIYKGTYERRVDLAGSNDVRDLMIQAGKDLRRAVDYLETRNDIRADKLAYYGLSWGAYWGVAFTAIEPRFKAAVFLAGGLGHYPPGYPPEANPLNFAPRSTVPALMINGRNDFNAPLETNIEPLFGLLGAGPDQKRLVVLEGGHVPESTNAFIREVLDWLDLYLGPAGRSD